MIEIEIPKDISKYEAKLIGPFTTRQTACFVAACALGIPAFMSLKNSGMPQDMCILITILIFLPAILIGWVKPYGMNFEKFLKTAFVSNILSPQKRKYISINTFEYLKNETFSYADIQKITTINKKQRKKEMQKKIKTDIDYMC